MPKENNILSLDPGIANTGFAWRIGKRRNCGTLTTAPTDNLGSRIKEMSEVFKEVEWDLVLIEDTFGKFMKKTQFLIGGYLGALTTKRTLLVPPAHWIKQLFGSGQKGKYKAKAVEYAQKAGWKPDTQHAADAASMLEWYVACKNSEAVP